MPAYDSAVMPQLEVNAHAPLKILVVDDDRTNRMVLSALVVSEGHIALSAQNGAQAVGMFASNQPDIVLMDVMMPVMDGYMAARRIKALRCDGFVPVVFLTALSDDASLAKCIEVGGDDFMTKPFNHVVLSAKLRSYTRLVRLYAMLKERNRELAVFHARLSREHEVAEQIFTAITCDGRLDAPNIRYLLSPMNNTSGDLILAAQTPSGGQHFLLGDFVGHGLSAALGAIPVSDIFYSMTAKGLPVHDIVREINAKLYNRLPTGFFLAACLVEVDAMQRMARVWNSGIPSAVLIRDGNRIFRRFESRNLPLGIVSSEQMCGEMECVELQQGDTLYMYSDGVIESTDRDGRMFGQSGLDECFCEGDVSPCDRFELINSRLAEFRGSEPQNDDIALVEITFDLSVMPESLVLADTINSNTPDWRCDLMIGASHLGDSDALPAVIDLMVRANGLDGHRSRLYTIVSELYNNSLDHGILRLNKRMKSSDAEFHAYYEARDAALSKLKDGFVKLSICCQKNARNRQVLIRVEDSGSGFDTDDGIIGLTENSSLHGRGISLVRSLCSEVVYHGNGNVVEAVYQWSDTQG